MSTIMACALAFNLSVPAMMTPAKTFEIGFKQTEAAKNVSQLMRSNAPHFWAFNRNPGALKDLAYYVDATGTISGDPHLGNMSVIPVKSQSGEKVLRFLNIDFDDGGKGPFALELARFIAVAKASSGDIKVKDLVAAYLQGLRGEQMEKPATIDRAEKMKMQDYEALRAAYVNKKMIDGHFKYKVGEIEKWDGRPNISDVAPLFADVKVIEVAKRPMERGGSADAGVRLWVLTLDAAGTYRIIELKPYSDTALSAYSHQADPQTRVRDLQETYWQGIDPSSYTLAEVQGNLYWVREKKVEILEYKDLVDEDSGRLYIANYIGLTQGRQAAAPGLLKKIESNPERFKEAIKNFVKEYMAVASAAME